MLQDILNWIDIRRIAIVTRVARSLGLLVALPSPPSALIDAESLDSVALAALIDHTLLRSDAAAAEIDDHLNRGRNMDTRTPAAACGFVV